MLNSHLIYVSIAIEVRKKSVVRPARAMASVVHVEVGHFPWHRDH